ncbi:MAG TPA: hypothetical protein P5316_02755 [Phycisphaerae bacterium]|nr:hypothetical protein [Phycisphaerae bacterium]
MEFLCILLSVLLFVTLIGHGLWVAIAWLLRGGHPKSDRRSFEPTLDDDRAATARYLTHLQARGLIDAETHARLAKLMAEDVHSVRAYLDKKHTPAKTTQPTAEPWQRPAGIQQQPAAPVASSPAESLPWAGATESAPVPALAGKPLDTGSGQKPPVAPGGTIGAAAPPPVTSLPTEPPSPAEPRRPFGEVVAAFMAEKNIRWGELVGGLLILCCSTALVISLWAQIEAIPILKFVIFTTVTAALFGVGLFVQHRWKLPTTGHVVLIISSLLVPLNLLAFAVFSPRGPTINAWTLIVELPAVALFAWLTLLAGRVIMSDGARLFASGIVVLSVCSLVIRFLSPLSASGLVAVGLLPVGCYVIVMGISLRRQSRVACIEDTDAKRLILQLGVQTFACLVPLGLLLGESGHLAGALHVLSPLICALAAPALLAGLLLVSRLAPAVPAQTRLTATSIALVAAAVMLIGVGLAWPTPSRLLPAMLLNALAAAAVCSSIRHPAMHAAVATWLTLAWILGIHMICGAVSWSEVGSRAMLAALFSARTGQALVGPVAACAVAAALLHRRQRRELAIGYDLSALVFSLLSIGVVTWFGFGVPGDAQHVIWVYLVYGAAAMVGAGRLKSTRVAWVGCILIQMAIIQAMVYAWPLQQFPWPTALLIGAGACTVAAVVLRLARLTSDAANTYVDSLAGFATVGSWLAVVWMLNTLPSHSLAAFSARMAWTSVIWAVVAIVKLWPILLTGAEIAIIVSTCTALQCHLRSLEWYRLLSSPFHDPWVWQAHLMVIGGFGLVLIVARQAITQWFAPLTSGDTPEAPAPSDAGWRSVARQLLEPWFPATDRWLVALPFLALVFLAGWSVAPAVVVEHGAAASKVAWGLHAHAAGAGSWILLALVAATLLLHIWEGLRRWALLGIIAAAACGLLLVVARFESRHQVVDAWRWLSACAFLAVSVAFWMRGYWVDRLLQMARCRPARQSGNTDITRVCLFCLFALPAVLLTASHMAAAGSMKLPISPDLTELRLHVALLGPVVLVIVSVIGYGLSERQVGYAVAAAGLACAAVTVTELHILRQTKQPFSAGFLIWLTQLNLIVSSVVPIFWKVLRDLFRTKDDRSDYPSGPLIAGRVAVGILLAVAATGMWISPQFLPSVTVAAGTLWGIAAALLVEYALLTSCRPSSANQRGHRESVWVLYGVALIACALAPLDTGNWLCFHVAMVGFVTAAAIRLWAGDRQARELVGAGWQETFDTASADVSGAVRQIDHDLSCTRCGYNLRGLSPSSRCPECGLEIPGSVETAVSRLTPQSTAERAQARVQAVTGVLACIFLATLLAMRAATDDPQRPWWSTGTMCALSVLCIITAAWAPRRALAYLGGVEICLAASVWWVRFFWLRLATFSGANLIDLVNVNVIALAAAGITWLLVERRFVLPRVPSGHTERWPSFHHAVATVSVVIVFLLALRAICLAAIGEPAGNSIAVSWLAWTAAVAIVLVCGLDSKSVHLPAGIYLLGLTGMSQIMAQTGMTPRYLEWAMSVGLAGYAVVTTLSWRRWTRTGPLAAARQTTDGWLPSANSILALIAMLLALHVSWGHPALVWRMLIVISPLLCAAWAVLTAVEARRLVMQTCAMQLLAAAAILFAWSWVSPEMAAGVLHRAVGLIAAVALATPVLAVVRTRIAAGDTWPTALTRSIITANALAVAGLAYCCASDALSILGDDLLPLTRPAVVAMVLALPLMIIYCILFATRDRLDPLQLDARRKEAYVYAAEVLAGLLTLHVRASMPWLFTGVIEQYWPLLVIALAFAAVAGQEACERYGQHVLARPLGRTGVFLPALSMLDLFIAASRVHFSVVLFTTGVLYIVLAATRRSMVMAVLAASSFTGSLWYLLYRTPGMGLTEHPQLWFIPPAIAVLIATHLNRDRLDEMQRRTVHYACLLTIYLSSTADIFLIGVAQAPWLPLILALLSVVGIFVGVALRIRSFLVLGTGFLCLSLLTMIYHAGSNLGWVWIWWASGIALGIAILFVFALFEKKRNEMVALLDQVRKWHD